MMSMRRRLLVSFLIVIIIGIFITGLYSFTEVQNLYVKSLENRLESNGRLIADAFIREYVPDRTNYDDMAKYYSEVSKCRITIITTNGVVIGESERSSKGMENHIERDEVKKALSGSIGRSTRFSATEGIDMLYIAVPATLNGKVISVIRLSVPLTYIQDIESQYLKYTLVAVFAGILSSFIIAYLFVRKIIKPINEMTLISSQIANGSYDKRIHVYSSDEIGEMSKSFNNMAEKLEITINDLSDKKNKLEAILKSMQNGVIAVNGIGRIILVNPAALSMFGLDGGVIGKHILEVFKNYELEDILRGDQDETREIKLNYPEKRILRVKATPIIDTTGRYKNIGNVVVMQDITELKQLEQMRSEFVANVSHELKTPLTSIKGFAETLKSGAIKDIETRDKFLDIINIEADRLTRLINDILSLSELENKRQNIVNERINLNEAVEEIQYIMESLARLKEINLYFNYNERPLWVMGNHDKVKQLLINLIDNGIKYTPKGGSVKVTVYSSGEFAHIEIADTGIGISKEHLSRIFERFYRVDKGRSRAMGGTGLGLAIVKHIVAAMGGSITVESEIGKGSTFTVIIPQAK